MNVLILGAYGQIARVATQLFLERTDARLTLYLRRAERLREAELADRVRVIEGDVLDAARLEGAMLGQDLVYANLDGRLEEQANAVVAAMQTANVRRLIFVSSMGIYDKKYRASLPARSSIRIASPHASSRRPHSTTRLCGRHG